jgi:large conductance mechanosensitive channel
MATYFGAIVKSLVNDIIMPPVGMLLGGVDFSSLKFIIQEAQGEQAEIALQYGLFINTILTFLIVSFAIFMVVKTYNKMQDKMQKKEEEVKKTDPIPTKEEVLLTEIRDLLKKK